MNPTLALIEAAEEIVRSGTLTYTDTINLRAAISSAKAAEEGEINASVICKECDGPMEWNLLCAHCGHSVTKPMPEFDAQWEALLATGYEIEPSPEEEGFARWGWNAHKAVIEVREKEG